MFVIQQWLQGKKNFTVGRSLYMTFGKEAAVKKLLQQGETPYSKELLERKLRELLSLPVAIATPQPVKEVAEMPASKDPVLEALRLEWQEPYQRMNYLRHQLDSIKGNSQEAIALRKPIAFEILDLEQQCMQVWEKRDRYLSSGTLPDVKPKAMELPDNPVELAKLLDAVKRNITRNRAKMKEFPDKPKYAQLYHEWKDKFKQITGHEYQEKN